MRHRQLGTHMVARLARVSPTTVLSWIDRGLLPAHRTPGGHRRVDAARLARFLREHQMPVPAELEDTSRLLVVDDEPAFLRSVRRVLAELSLSVETALGGLEGLVKVGQWQPDALLLDAHMPDLGGVEVCRHLKQREETRHIRVVAISGGASAGLERALIAAGASACLPKPLDPQALLSALDVTPDPQEHRPWRKPSSK